MRKTRARIWNGKAAAALAAAFLLVQTDISLIYGIDALAAPDTKEGTRQVLSEDDTQADQETLSNEIENPVVLQTISIRTPEELITFSQNCVSESYSKGKLFILEEDINLQGTDFTPIPVFAGMFDGNGHTIIGLSIQKAGSDLGLFRYVEEGATVKALTLHGTISPKGSCKNIGGIVGVNRGTIEACIFSGEMMAQETLGGIAGCNEKTGTIVNCTNQGQLTGNRKTGGIVGNNVGTVENCRNQGEINATGQGVEIETEAEASLTVGNMNLEETVRVEKVNDAGGIAGFSQGTIRNCRNDKTIGYPHVGYNIGGIVGRQSGVVEQCQNYGAIRGRKDVGGIVGQFEPYIEISYDEDTLGKLEDELDELSHMGDNLSRLIDQTGDMASGNLDQVGRRMDRVRDIGEFYRDVFRSDNDELNQNIDTSVEEIQYQLDRISFDLTDKETESQYRQAQEKIRLIKELSKELDQGYPGSPTDLPALRKWLQDRYNKISQMYQYTVELAGNLSYLAVHVPKHAVDEVEDLSYRLEQVQMEASVLTDILQGNRDSIRRDLEDMGDEMSDELDLLSGNVDTLTDDLKNSRIQIRNQKNQIQDQIDQMRTTISDGIDRSREERDLFEDISDTDEEINEGTIFACENQGGILADYQSGGIVGIIGMEVSLDPEQDLEAEEEKTLNAVRNAKALVKGSVNKGNVQVKNDYAGGIAGKANLGALIQNQNYGDIVAKDGSYAGGITGSSDYVLRQNYSKCSVDGNDYAGGIAGWANDLKDNYAMVSIRNMAGEWIGSVAGDVDSEGMVEGNFYVDEGIGAIDNITREGQTEGLSYEMFCSMEQIPKEFNKLTVTFLVEEQVIKTIDCQYGGEVAAADIPKAPQKDGYYYQWEEKDLSCIKGNESVHAIYKAWNTTIASSGDKMPLMLAESNFYPGTTLAAGKNENAQEITAQWEKNGVLIPKGYNLQGQYTYNITQPEGVDAPESITIHVLAEGLPKQSVVCVFDNGTLKAVESRWDGSYLIFRTNGRDNFFILIPEKSIFIQMMPAAAALILMIAATAWIAVKMKGKKRNTQKVEKNVGNGGENLGEYKEESKEENQEEIASKTTPETKAAQEGEEMSQDEKGRSATGGRPLEGD